MVIRPPHSPPTARGRPHGRDLVAARCCAVAPWAALPVLPAVSLLGGLPAPAVADAMAAVVVLAVLGLLWVLARHPVSGRRDGELTLTLLAGPVCMVPPAQAGGPAVMTVVPLVVPLAVAGAAVWERCSGAGRKTARKHV